MSCSAARCHCHQSYSQQRHMKRHLKEKNIKKNINDQDRYFVHVVSRLVCQTNMLPLLQKPLFIWIPIVKHWWSSGVKDILVGSSRHETLLDSFTRTRALHFQSWHLWKIYCPSVTWYSAPLCHRFLQMGFSPQTLWPLEGGAAVWSHERPQKSEHKLVFVFKPVSLCFDWVACVPTL